MGLRKRAPGMHRVSTPLLLYGSSNYMGRPPRGLHKSSRITTRSFITADPDFAPLRDANSTSAASTDNGSEDGEYHDAPTVMTNTTAGAPSIASHVTLGSHQLFQAGSYYDLPQGALELDKILYNVLKMCVRGSK